MKRRTFAFVLAWFALAGGGLARADFYDLSDDWSDSSNPNGAWSYWVGGSMPSTSYSRGGDPFDNPPGYQPIWAHGNGEYFGWSKNNGSNVYTWDIQVGDVYGHTAGVLAIQWTSPEAGPAESGRSGTSTGRTTGRSRSTALF